METTDADQGGLALGKPVELVALAVKQAAIRCKVLATGEPVTLRRVRFEVPGEVLTIHPENFWRHKTTLYASGETVASRIDIPALGLTPLGLRDEGVWKPENEDWGDDDCLTRPYFDSIIAAGARARCEMEQVIPGQDPDDFESDPIIEASEALQGGDEETAFRIIENILVADLRCLDAHAHLGNWSFPERDVRPSDWALDRARKHYEVGVKIGELSLGPSFNGVLPWGLLDNRPFLRCLHGYGLCLWRQGRIDEARAMFDRMLRLNPTDNQGVRFLVHDIDEGRPWSPDP